MPEHPAAYVADPDFTLYVGDVREKPYGWLLLVKRRIVAE